MAILTDYQATKFRQLLHEDLDLLIADNCSDKTELKAAFQAVEDFWEDNRAALKSKIDIAMGRTISNALAKKIGKYWLKYKWGLE